MCSANVGHDFPPVPIGPTPPAGVSSPTTSHHSRARAAAGKRCGTFLMQTELYGLPTPADNVLGKPSEHGHDNTSTPSPPETPDASPRSSGLPPAGHLPFRPHRRGVLQEAQTARLYRIFSSRQPASDNRAHWQSAPRKSLGPREKILFIRS